MWVNSIVWFLLMCFYLLNLTVGSITIGVQFDSILYKRRVLIYITPELGSFLDNYWKIHEHYVELVF